MRKSKVFKVILDDMNNTISEMCSQNLIRDCRGISQKQIATNTFQISFAGKKPISNVVYEKNIEGEEIIGSLLEELQYTLTFYDKSIIQAEFLVNNENITKERLVFIKKHNRQWRIDEIDKYESSDEDWFSEKGIPIFIRIDYDPEAHVELKHASSHMTIANHESCRIPLKGIVTFSEFVRFVLNQFYSIDFALPQFRFEFGDTITELEKETIHINWE